MKVFVPKALPPKLSFVSRPAGPAIMRRNKSNQLVAHTTADTPILQEVNNARVPFPFVNLYSGPDPLVAYGGTHGVISLLKIGTDNWNALTPGETLTLSADVVCSRAAADDGGSAMMALFSRRADGTWTAQAVAYSADFEPHRLSVTLTLPALASDMADVGVGVWHSGGAATYPGSVALQVAAVVRGSVAPQVWNEEGGLFVINPQSYTNLVPNNHNTAALPTEYNPDGATGTRAWQASSFHSQVLRITKTSGADGARYGVRWAVNGAVSAEAHTASIWVRRPAGTVKGFAPYVDMSHGGGIVNWFRSLSTLPPDVWTKAVSQSPVGPAVNYTGGMFYVWVEGPVGSYIDVVIPNVIAGVRPTDGSGRPADFASVITGATIQETPADTIFSNYTGPGQETGQNGSASAYLLTNAVSNPLWSAGTPYASPERVVHAALVYERTSVAYTNTGVQLFQAPPLAPTLWAKVGPDDRLLAFDGEINSRTYLHPDPASRSGNLWFLGSMGLYSDSLLISDVYNVQKLHVQVRQGLTGPVVADFTHDFETSGELARSQFLLTGLRPSTNLVFQISARGSDSPGIGLIAWGKAEAYGATLYGPRAGVRDYSRKEPDQFGQVVFVRRAFAKTVSASVQVEKSQINTAQDRLGNLRATPAVWIFSDDADYAVPLVVFGFYKDFYSVIDKPMVALYTLEIEGLT